MSGANDAMLARLQAELEDRRQFQDQLVEAAQTANRDLNTQEMELYQRAATRMGELEAQLEPLRESARIAATSSRRNSELLGQFQQARGGPSAVEYRSAGAYIADRYYAQLGDIEAQQRMDIFNRVAAHQTTADNPGLIPEQIVSPLVNFIEVARPICATLGPTDLGSGAWSYARVTQHTQVGKQAGEKTELPSRKMLVTKTPLGADTYGGYVNVSKQDINRSSPSILDMVINDLAQQYAIETEDEAANVLWTGGTGGPILPSAPTAEDINTAIWGAAGAVFAATKGQGSTIVMVSPDMLGVIGPILGVTSPLGNTIGSGFAAGNIQQGNVGSVSGLTINMSAGLDVGQIVVYSTAAAKAFEYKYGNLQVVEPSVWGVQVGYAGDFDCVVIEPAGVIKVTKTP